MDTKDPAEGLPPKKDTPGTLPKVRMPIRLKIILPYLLLCVLLAAGAGFLLTQVVFDSLEERFTNQLIESGKLASEWMYREEERLLSTLRLLINTQGVADAIQARDAEKLRELTFGITVSNQEEAVEILDEKGYLLLSMRHRSGGNLEEYDFAKDGDQSFLQWDFVKKVVQAQPDAYSDKYSGLAQAEWGDTYYIAAPVLNAMGRQVGTILVGKSLPTLVRQIRQETLAQVSLYSFSGSVYCSTFSQAAPIDGSLASQVLGNQDLSSLSRSLRNLQVSNIDYQEVVGPWEVRDDTDLGLIGLALAKSFYVNPDRVTRLQIALLVSAAFLLVILLGINLARLITRPLISLVQASTRVSQGDLKVQVAPSSNDEVAVLTEAFNQMVTSLQVSHEALLHAYDRTLEGWSKALELRDKETEGHTLRVTRMTVELARGLGLPEQDLAQIQRGALLHDIGKMGVPDNILLKPGPLTDEEWAVMRKHPQYAFELLWPVEYLRLALDIPYHHHERWDGSGYPHGLAGEQIPLAARIFAVVDTWDALVSERPYKRPMSEAEAAAEIKAKSGLWFDPQVVEFFLAHLEQIVAAGRPA